MRHENRRGFAISGALFALTVLSFSDTARAQTVTVDPQTVNFTATANIVSTACNGNSTCKVHVTGNGVSTVQVQVSSQSPWITVTPSVLNLPANGDDLNVSINTTSLPAGSSSGSFVVFSSANASIKQTVTVNVNVTGSSQLTANPQSLSFQGSVGAVSGTPQNCPIQNGPASCQITIASSGPQLTYNITPTTTDGHQWLQPDAASGQTSGAPFNVAVNPSAVPGPGTYSGSILVQSTTTSDAVTIAVTMVVAAAPTFSVTPSSLTFYYTVNGTVPPAQTATVSATSGTVPFSVTQSAGSSWLTVTPISGAASSVASVPLSVSVNPSGLSTGPHTATITVTPNGGTAQAVNVTFVVSVNPFLTASSTTLSFNAQFGGSAPAAQGIVVGSTGGALTYSASASSDKNWLNISPNAGVTGTPTGTVSVTINQGVLSTLGVGTYNGSIVISPTNGDQYNLQIPVTLTIGTSSQISAAPQALFFSYQIGQSSPAAQTITLASPQNVGFSVATALSGSNPAGCGNASWLAATPQTSPLTAPNVLTVTVNTTGMTPATCTGTIKITYGASNTELDVPVTLFVATTPLLNISLPQAFGVESTVLNAPGFTRNITLTSTDGTTAIQYQVGFQAAPCAWMSASPSSGSNPGTTPSTAQVNFFPSCLTTPGSYQGSVTLTSSNLPQAVTMPITLNVTSNVQVSVAPQSLSFSQAQNGPLPPAQNLNFTVSGGNANFVATANADLGNWLQVTPTSGNTSLGSVSVSVAQNSLPPSATPYNGRITITFQNAATPTAVIPVTYTVNQPQTVTVTPTSLTFAYQLSGSAPSAQQVNIASTGGAVNFTAAVNSNGGWLGIDATSGATPANGNPKAINVSVDPSKIPAGTGAGAALQGTITISAPGVLANPAVVNVTLNISAAPVPQPTTILNSASNSAASIAPGELITIKGTNLGPASPANGTVFTVNAQGGVDSTLAGVQVTFNGTAGIPTYVSATQINVIVPWEAASFSSVAMVIKYNGGQSAPFNLNVVQTSPAIYTQNAQGTGQAAAVNLSGVAISPYNGPAGSTYPGTNLPLVPAAQGSFISLFLTGCGQTSPSSVTGSINSGTQLMPLRGWTAGSNVVTATIGNQPATVQFAGAAPTLVSGVCQVNLQVPSGVSGNAVPVSITINGAPTLGSATIAVQ